MNKVRLGLSRVHREARWLTSALVMSALLAVVVALPSFAGALVSVFAMLRNNGWDW